MKTVDTQGYKCPEPLIMTRKALKDLETGEILLVITDNETSLNNLKRFLADNNTEFTVESSAGVHRLKVTRGSDDFSRSKPAEYCEVSVNPGVKEEKSYIVIFSSERMGEGNEDLGLMLTKSFITTLLESDSLPTEILFYNSGVKLAVDDSFVIEELKKLENSGVKLLLCGTCINFYNLKSEINIGTVSNMYEMSEVMMRSKKIIKP